MPTTKPIPANLVVKKVDGGYQIHVATAPKSELVPLNKKIYFHPTSAYAGIGRLVHTANIASHKLTPDPARAPEKEAAK